MTRMLGLVFIMCAMGCGGGAAESDAAAGTDASAPDTSVAVDSGTSDAPTSDAGVDPCAAGACDPCDDGLAIDADAMAAARAMGICSGLASASWVLPDGSPAPSAADIGHGVLADFGMLTPREGARLLALSTGTARDPSDPGHQSPTGFARGQTVTAPPGFPMVVGDCPPAAELADAIALEVELDVPAGARGARFLIKHHTSEWPAYVCSGFNDHFVTLMEPRPAEWFTPNVVLDPDNQPISSYSMLIDVCACAGGPPCPVGGRSYACSAGAGELAGTGYDLASAGAATRWLETRIPVTAGTRITLRFAVWDAGDGPPDPATPPDGLRRATDPPASPQTRVAP